MSLDVQQHNDKVLGTLEVGDLVEFPGRIYSHWTVYIGDHEFVHLSDVDRCGTAADSSSSHVCTISGKACVKREDYLKVAKDSKMKKNNDKDNLKGPFPREQIKERAVSKIGTASYRLLWYNCEHFAAWCRNGIKKSQQADTALTYGVALGAVAVTGGVAYEAYTGGKHMRGGIVWPRSGPTSSSATNFEDFTAGGPNGIHVPNQANYATSWVGMALGALVGVGRLCYAAYTDLNDRRASSTSYSPMWDNFPDGTRIGIHPSGRFCMDMGCRTGTCVFKASAYGMNWPK